MPGGWLGHPITRQRDHRAAGPRGLRAPPRLPAPQGDHPWLSHPDVAGISLSIVAAHQRVRRFLSTPTEPFPQFAREASCIVAMFKPSDIVSSA